jgi:hypothetical protein
MIDREIHYRYKRMWILQISGNVLAQQRLSHKVVGHTNSQNGNRRVLKCVACKSNLSSDAKLTPEFQTASGSHISTTTVQRELHEMDFHDRAAAHKPKITMRNAKRRLEWCKVMTHALPSGSPMDESRFGKCQKNATYPNA